MKTTNAGVPDWLHTPWMREEWAKQNQREELASYFAAHLGMVTDACVRRSIQEIKKMPFILQDEAFEVLDVMTQNGHAHGMAADVRDEITAARDEWLEQFREMDE